MSKRSDLWVHFVCITVAIIALIIAVVTRFQAGPAAVGESATVRAFVDTACGLRTCPQKIEDQSIPRVIYRTGPSRTALSVEGPTKKAWEFTALNNPEYTQVFFDDEEADNFMKTTIGGRAYELYQQLVPGAAKADLFRYCIIYERGGIYLDSKSGARPLCSLIRPNDKMLVSTWGHTFMNMDGLDRKSYGELEQWWLAAEPRHPVMHDVIQQVVANIENAKPKASDDSTKDVLVMTGPIAFTNVVDRHLKQESNVRLVCADGSNIMVYDVDGSHSSGKGYKGLQWILNTFSSVNKGTLGRARA